MSPAGERAMRHWWTPPSQTFTKPQAQCQESVAFSGGALRCDRPAGHLPPESPVATVVWTTGRATR